MGICVPEDAGAEHDERDSSVLIDAGPRDASDDTGCTQRWYADDDGDDFGDPDDFVIACSPPDGYVEDATDCEPTIREAFPGGDDEDCDGVDNDCDGRTCREIFVDGGVVTEDVFWDELARVHLSGVIRMRGATLTIGSGVTVLAEGDAGIVIESNSRIDARGTSDEPIVMTSSRAPGARSAGDWLGVALLGRAPTTEGSSNTSIRLGDGRAPFGGDDETHDCGVLRYVEIQFPGRLSGAYDLDGLFLGACGSRTEISNVHVHRSADDGLRVLGGTNAIDHLLITGFADDGIDFATGWVGSVQFAIIHSYTEGDRSIEGDNDRDAVDGLPRSQPEMWNMVVSGHESVRGVELRQGAWGRIGNTLFRSATRTWNITGPESEAGLAGGEIDVVSSVFSSSGPLMFDDGDSIDEHEIVTDSTRMNAFGSCGIATGTLDGTDPSWGTAVPSLCEDGASPPEGLDRSATFVGATEPGGADWYGWASFPLD